MDMNMSMSMSMDLLPMILVMIPAGFLSTMNIWVANPDDIRLHINDVYMVFLMISWMILLFSIYDYKHQQPIVIVASAISILVIMYCIRNQVFVNDTQFMKGMIPHHSMAITMAEKIKEKSDDERIINLANNIIKSQSEEIAYMKNLGY